MTPAYLLPMSDFICLVLLISVGIVTIIYGLLCLIGRKPKGIDHE